MRCPRRQSRDRDHCDPDSDFNLRIPKCNRFIGLRIPEKKCIPDTKRNELFGKCDPDDAALESAGQMIRVNGQPVVLEASGDSYKEL